MGETMIKKLVLALGLLFAVPAFADVSLTQCKRESSGSEVRVYCYLAFDSSYPTGGESINKALLGLTRVNSVIVESKSGYVFSYDYASEKLQAYYRGSGDPYSPAALTEVANATNLGALSSVRINVYGK